MDILFYNIFSYVTARVEVCVVDYTGYVSCLFSVILCVWGCKDAKNFIYLIYVCVYIITRLSREVEQFFSLELSNTRVTIISPLCPYVQSLILYLFRNTKLFKTNHFWRTLWRPVALWCHPSAETCFNSCYWFILYYHIIVVPPWFCLFFSYFIWCFVFFFFT